MDLNVQILQTALDASADSRLNRVTDALKQFFVIAPQIHFGGYDTRFTAEMAMRRVQAAPKNLANDFEIVTDHMFHTEDQIVRIARVLIEKHNPIIEGEVVVVGVTTREDEKKLEDAKEEFKRAEKRVKEAKLELEELERRCKKAKEDVDLAQSEYDKTAGK